MAGVNKYNHQHDMTDILGEFNRRLKSAERSVSSLAMATSFAMETEPWPAEGPNGDHASAIGVLWFDPANNAVYRWSENGEWVLTAAWPAQKSFWRLDAAFNVGGGGGNTDINAWVDDGDTNSYLITMASGQDITVARAGLYRINVGITYPVNATGRRYVQIFTGTSGGNVIVGDWRGASSTGVVSPQVSRIVRLDAAAVFRVTANQDSGVTLGLLAGSNFSYLQVEYVGP